MKKTEKESKLLSMSEEEFDKYMCETYPHQFAQRNLPMSETCMCWGFCIGKGWYPILDELCTKLDLIEAATGITTVFVQVKEKFGTARFYVQMIVNNLSELKFKLNDDQKGLWCDIIHCVVSDAERKTDSTCAECGEQFFHDQIVVGGWYYDLCKECFTKIHPERAKSLNIVHQNADGKWYFWNETETEELGPFDTEDIATEKLDEYAKKLDQQS